MTRLDKPIYKGIVVETFGGSEIRWYKHKKWDIKVLDIPVNTNWDTEARKMFSQATVIDGNVINYQTTYNQNGLGMYIVCFSKTDEPVLSISSYNYEQNHILDDNQYHSKYTAILQNIPIDDKDGNWGWAKAAAWWIRFKTPDKINNTEIDKKYSTWWNAQIKIYVIFFTKAATDNSNGIYFEGDTNTNATDGGFSKWTIDTIIEDVSTGMQRRKYYSRVMGINDGSDWKRVGEMMLKYVPKDINGDVVTRTRIEDKGVLGLFIIAEGTPKFGWSLAVWGLTAGSDNQMEAQIMDYVGKWEAFNKSSLDAIVKSGLVPETIGGRKVIPGTLIWFQSTFGLFLKCNVEPSTGIPWQLYLIGGVAVVVMGYGYVTKGKGESINIINKK